MVSSDLLYVLQMTSFLQDSPTKFWISFLPHTWHMPHQSHQPNDVHIMQLLITQFPLFCFDFLLLSPNILSISLYRNILSALSSTHQYKIKAEWQFRIFLPLCFQVTNWKTKDSGPNGSGHAHCKWHRSCRKYRHQQRRRLTGYKLNLL